MYNIGDWVKVKESAFDHPSTGLDFAEAMREFLGGTYQVEKIEDENYKLKNVCSKNKRINGDGLWLWCDEWLEPADIREINVSEDDFMNMF